MSTVELSATAGVCEEDSGAAKPRILHRLAAVRRSQGISRRLLARRLKVEIAEIRRQELTEDLPLTVLIEWQKVLEVPFAELLADAGETLSRPLLERAKFVRLMKTALAILEQADNDATRAMAQEIVDQLVKVMPELSGLSPWHLVGRRRRRSELGVAASRVLSEEIFLTHDEHAKIS